MSRPSATPSTSTPTTSILTVSGGWRTRGFAPVEPIFASSDVINKAENVNLSYGSSLKKSSILNVRDTVGGSGVSLTSSREMLSGEQLPFDSVAYSSFLDVGDIFFAINLSQEQNRPAVSGRNLGLRTRGASLSSIVLPGKSLIETFSVASYPFLRLGGLTLKTLGRGNDVILVSGIGRLKDQTIVDRGKTYVNIGNDQDVVIGGYGQDFFGSRDPQDLLGLQQATRNTSSVSAGSKFFIGGSFDDLLDGGSDADLLVGDRFNGYEIYLPSTILQGITAPWAVQVAGLKAYQPVAFTDGTGAGSSILAESPGAFSAKSYPLWVPGNDIIRGYESNDVIYGDETVNNNLAQLINLRQFLSNTPDEVVQAGGISDKNWNSIKLGADFIDAGAGNDQVDLGFGADAVIGGEGADLIDSGPQVIVPGYNPFYGPKVIYGDDATFNGNVWVSDSLTKAPDQFLIGSLYSTEQDLRESNAGVVDKLSANKKIVADQLAGFEKAWKTYGKIVKSIPKAGTLIQGLVDVGLKLAKLNDPTPPPIGPSPKPLDGLTVIKDFDPFDQLTFALGQGESFEVVFKDNWTVNTTGSDNPLMADINGPGTMIVYGKTASEKYDRVFLQGYRSGMVQLGKRDESGTEFYQFGGSDFSEVFNEQGQRVFGDLIGRDPRLG